jgi:hypothetical protein
MIIIIGIIAAEITGTERTNTVVGVAIGLAVVTTEAMIIAVAVIRTKIDLVAVNVTVESVHAAGKDGVVNTFIIKI